jgi:hypothetical protein
MSRCYLCSVSSRFPENYEIGIRAGKWGVERRYEKRIAPVRAGDRIAFVVGGAFRSIHPVIRAPYEDMTPIWPPKDGDSFPYRIDIGLAEIAGNVPVGNIAAGISFMRDRRWGGTLQGANGVFNSRLTAEDEALLRDALRISAKENPPPRPVPERPVLQLQGTFWLRTLLDQLASLSELQQDQTEWDPFAGAPDRVNGMVAGIYADRANAPTLALLPLDRGPDEVVLSTLYGLSALRQVHTRADRARGVIFVPDSEVEVTALTGGLANVEAVPFRLRAQVGR